MKKGIIKKMYYDPAGYGSLKNTLADAKEIDPTLKEDDVNHFSINEFQEKTYLHPHCYATEGLCFFHLNGFSQYSEIIKKSAQWLSEIQNDDGSIYNWQYNDNLTKEKQGDVTSQSIRIWLFEDKNKYKEAG